MKNKLNKKKNTKKKRDYVTYWALEESPFGQEEGTQCIKEESLCINDIEGARILRTKMDQLCHAI